MGGLTDKLRAFLDANHVGVLGTVTSSGKPRQSLVYYAREGNRLLISTESKRMKAQDVRRAGWASLCVRGDQQPYPSAAFSGSATVRTQDIGLSTARVMQRVAGASEPPEPQTDDALAAIDRVILEITIENVSAVSYMDG